MTEPEWGPWIEHDGRGCPCVGQYVQSELRCGLVECHVASGEYNSSGNSWNWNSCNHMPQFQVILYRIRKPRAMKLLQSIVENPPKQLIKEDA